MHTSRFASRAIAILILAVAASSVFAQASEQAKRAETKAWVNDYLRYFHFESKFQPPELEQFVDLKLKLDAPATSLEDRQKALTDLATILYRAAGANPMPPEAAFVNLGRTNGQIIHKLLTDPASKPPSSATTPLGQLGHVEKRGRGPLPMILIADLRTDWTIYQNFMDHNAERYTMYAVTLPGFGGTPPPPKPASLEVTATPWWDGAEKGIVNLIEKNRLHRPVVVGMAGSGYLAARLALDHPDKIRSVVTLDGTVYSPFRSLANPDYPATPEERPSVLMAQPGAIGMLTELLPSLTPTREAAEARIKALPAPPLSANLRDLERARALAIKAALESDPRAYRYNTELFAADLSPAFKALKIPMLAIVAVPDDKSPGQGGPTPAEWQELKLRYPAIPLTVVPFENARSYITEEAPQELDKAVEAFLAGKPVEGRQGRSIALRPSPRAAIMQAIGATEVSITWGRPQVNKREVWGKLVPYNRVWRTGANEATNITFSTDVLIEGQKLVAGTYALSTIPTENEWTIIFNKVSHQWGAFYYNPAFDALRVKIKPQTAEHEEWLTYSFENLSPTSMQMVIHWEKVKVACKIELEPVKAAASGN